MNLVYIAALVAVCGAAKLDRTYLPPASSKTAGGGSDLLVPHFRDYFEPGRSGLPKGAEENEFDGVVVEAAAPGTRAKDSEESGLGGSRISYGSTHSKVGDAAFRMKQQQRPIGNAESPAGHLDSHTSQNIHQDVPSEFNRPQSSVDQTDFQAAPNYHQAAQSEFNRPQPSVDQSDSQASPNYHQAAPSEFNKPHPSADQSDSQATPHFNQAVPSESKRPRPPVGQSDSQATPNFHQHATSEFYRPRPVSDQSESQVSHGSQQGALSHLSRPRLPADLTHIQSPQNFQGAQYNSNRFRPVSDQSGSQTSQNFPKGTSFNFFGKRPQSALERISNTVRFENNVGSKAYNYAYETENGITAEERGVSSDGVRAQGGYSYTGDDGKLYKITYTAGEGGYQPVGDHLPTPPPIPDEILKSLEENAKEDAEGSDDDGSYDTAKYNAEDDYTKSDNSNSRPLAFGKKPESDVNLSGTSNNNRKDQTNNNRFREQPSFENNLTSIQNGLESNYGKPTTNFDQQTYDTTKFEPSQNEQSEDDATITQSGLTNSDNNVGLHKQSDEFGSNDFSRPINLGPTQFSQVGVHSFSNKQSNVPTSNYFAQNQLTGIQPDTIQPELSPLRELQGLPPSSNFDEKNINQQKVGSQDDSQIISHDTKHMNNIDLNKNSNVPKHPFNIYPNIYSTLQPSLELTTPYEYSSNSNRDKNFDNSSQNQIGLSHPTQQSSFSTQPIVDSQTNVMVNDEFITSNANADSQLHNSNSQQDFNYSLQLPSVGENNFNINSPNNPKQDQPYYYNQPSIIFNPYVRPTTPIFAPKQSENGFGSTVSTKYPSPPTVATSFPTMFPGRNMYDQNSNIPQPIITQNNRLSAITRYPQPPSLGHIVLAPTSPTTQNNINGFTQHTGITQASVSPFPSISPSKYNFNYNSEQIGSTDETFSPDSQSNKIREGINHKPESIKANAQHVPNLNTLGEQTRPGQQYDGEVYEYKKPTESLITPTESDESIQQSGFSQFGQKLKPTTTHANTNYDNKEKQNAYDRNQNQGSQPLVRPESQNFQPQSNLQINSESNNGVFNKNKLNRQPIGHAMPTSSSQFSSGTFNEVQTTAGYNGHFTVTSGPNNGVTKDKINKQSLGHALPTSSSQFSTGAFDKVQTTSNYNGQFGFSSRIRPCCQGSRRTSISKTPDRLPGNNFQSSAPFGNQNTNLRPGAQSGNLFSTQSSGLPKDLQNAQTTSQSLFSAKEDEFDRSRKPPSFDEVSGYHY